MNQGSPNGQVNAKHHRRQSKGRTSYDKAQKAHDGKYAVGRGVFVQRSK